MSNSDKIIIYINKLLYNFIKLFFAQLRIQADPEKGVRLSLYICRQRSLHLTIAYPKLTRQEKI